MVISNLVGGLGNQMFQYAAGKALAKRLDTQLYLDTTAYKKYKLHKYNLNKFKISSEPISQIKLAVFKRLPSVVTFQEQHFHFNRQFLKLSGNTYLSGYWQSEKYFKAIRRELGKDFQLRNKLRSKNLELKKIIESSESVSIHVRRGDYLKPSTQKVHGLLGIDYYNRSIKLLRSKLNSPTFVFFSDDLAWVKTNLSLKQPSVFVSGNQQFPEQDMVLMSLCKHHITANSSFSWWGAWLNQNSRKMIIAPKKWFCSSKFNTKDLIPPNWTRF